ncbi:MAG: hypothetical protein AVDCRST_MAG87-4009, partial [uncultured Thermomicrobiales bacterium]
ERRHDVLCPLAIVAGWGWVRAGASPCRIVARIPRRVFASCRDRPTAGPRRRRWSGPSARSRHGSHVCDPGRRDADRCPRSHAPADRSLDNCNAGMLPCDLSQGAYHRSGAM